MGFSKNPVDVVRDRKLSQGEVADALRLGLWLSLMQSTYIFNYLG
jgi:hypothetical protein